MPSGKRLRYGSLSIDDYDNVIIVDDNKVIAFYVDCQIFYKPLCHFSVRIHLCILFCPVKHKLPAYV